MARDAQYKMKIYAPEIEGKFRHQYILKTFDDLKVGEFIKLSNDHDPKPLYYLFLMEREDMFIWEYLEEGPDLWCVAIGKKA